MSEKKKKKKLYVTIIFIVRFGPATFFSSQITLTY